MFWTLCINVSANFACVCVLWLGRWGHSVAVAVTSHGSRCREAGSDEVIQQAGLRLWQLVLRSVPVLTGAVVQWAWCYGPSFTPALPHCCFFISLVLAQGAVRLARPTAWTHSCRALGPSHSVALPFRLCLWSHTVTTVLTGNKGSGYVPNTLVNSIMQALNTLMCGDNSRIIEGTDAIWPQPSFVATCLSYGWWKIDKMDWWGSGEGPLITW